MSQKKVVIFMPSIEGGGVEKNLFIISNFLGKKLSKTILITADRSFNSKFKNIHVINPNIKIEKIKIRRLKYLFCLIELIKLFFANKNYLVFAFQANLYCSIICKFFGIKIIIRSNSSPSGWKLGLLKHFVYKKLLKIPKRIIVNSNEFKREYKKKFNLNVRCIYNPLNKSQIIKLSNFKVNNFFSKNFKGLKIIFIGRLVDQKDPMTFLNALKILKKKILFRSIIIGKGVYFQEVKKFIDKEELKKDVRIIKWQSNPYKYMKYSDLLVSTSKFEGLPNTLLEALCLKKFVISTNCPTGPKEILSNGRGGILFNVGDYKDLAKKIIFFSNNKRRLMSKINFAYKNLRRFDMKKNLNLYLNEIKREI